MKPEEQVRAAFEAWWRATWDVETKFHVDSAGRYLEEDQRNAFYGYRAAYAQARREALEEASSVAMNGPITAEMLDSDSAKAVSFHIAARIKQLIKD